MDSLFDTIPQDVHDITTAYTDYGLQVSINIALTTRYQQGMSRVIRRVYGVKDCFIDPTVKDKSNSTTFIVTFTGRKDAAHHLPEMREQIKDQARQYVQFVLDQPTQTSLF